MVRLPRSRRRRQRVDPNLPHEFEETNNAGLGAAAAGGLLKGNDVNMFAVTTAFLRGTRCAVSGCGRPREDPIHEPADD